MRSILSVVPGRWIICLAVLSLCSARSIPAAEPIPTELLGQPRLFLSDFQSGELKSWELGDPKAWQIVDDGDRKVLDLFQQSQVQTPVRSPFNRAMIKDLNVGDLVLDLDFKSTKTDYPHRDLCLFFGYQDPAHLYYVHFGKRADDAANQIFIVNNAPRKKISLESTPGTNWTNDWHHARVVRKVESGSIEVYFDDMQKPAMKAIDKTFLWGQVGVGSFDDIGRFDRVALFGQKVTPPAK